MSFISGPDQAFDSLQNAFEARVPNVSQTLDKGELMGTANLAHYFSVGDSAIRLVKSALLASRKRPGEIQRILDLPCGHGRVLRTFRAAFPNASLTASDLLADGVEFCAKEFNAIPVVSKKNPTVDLFPDAGKYDLIFVGSLLTHLDAPRWPVFLKLFNDLLAPNGILIVTVHGQFVAYRLEAGHTFGYTDQHIPAKPPKLPGAIPTSLSPFARHLLYSYYTRDFGFTAASAGADYGISVARPSWVFRQFEEYPDLKLLYYHERGWDNHQDAVALIKKPFVSPSVAYDHPFNPQPNAKLHSQRPTRSPL